MDHGTGDIGQREAAEGEHAPAVGSPSGDGALATSDPVAPTADPLSRNADRQEPRNFFVLAFYQITMRIGWIFKTESIVMPAVLDTLGGSAWLRGLLPTINRFGQSIPPLLFARRLKVMRRKKWALTACSLGMSASFLALAGLWAFGGDGAAWAPAFFLLAYALFFVLTGLNQQSFSTLQGKLIQVTHRGRLMLVANIVGATLAITAAYLIMTPALAEEIPRIDLIFGVSGAFFALAAMWAAALREPADDHAEPPRAVRHLLGDAARLLGRDRHFRQLTITAALFGTSLTLFPHYQALGRQELQIDMTNLVWWVMVQNFGTALFSIVAGPLADWRGNRLVLRLMLFALAAAPAMAITLAGAGPAAGPYFTIVFLMIGVTPVTLRCLMNYTLELSAPAEHARYVATMSLCIAAPPFLLSPLVGLLVDTWGFTPVFGSVIALQLAAAFYTFGLYEPRGSINADYGGQETV